MWVLLGAGSGAARGNKGCEGNEGLLRGGRQRRPTTGCTEQQPAQEACSRTHARSPAPHAQAGRGHWFRPARKPLLQPAGVTRYSHDVSCAVSCRGGAVRNAGRPGSPCLLVGVRVPDLVPERGREAGADGGRGSASGGGTPTGGGGAGNNRAGGGRGTYMTPSTTAAGRSSPLNGAGAAAGTAELGRVG